MRSHTLKVQRDRMIVRANTYFVSSFGYIIGGMLDVARYDNILRDCGTEDVGSSKTGALFAVMDRSPLNVEEWRLLWIFMDEYHELFGNVSIDESCPRHRNYLARFDDAFLNLRKCTWYRYFRSRLDTVVLIDSNVDRCDRMRARRGTGSDQERCGWRFYTYLQNRMYKQLYRALNEEELRNFPWHTNIDGTDKAYLTSDAYIDLANLDGNGGGDNSNSIRALTTTIDGAVDYRLLDESSAIRQVGAVVSAIQHMMCRTLNDNSTSTSARVFAPIKHKFYLPSPSKRCQRDPIEANFSAHVYREVGRTLVKRLRDNGDTSVINRLDPTQRSSNSSTMWSSLPQVNRVYTQLSKRFKPLYPLEQQHLGNTTSDNDDAAECDNDDSNDLISCCSDDFRYIQNEDSTVATVVTDAVVLTDASGACN